MMPWPSEGGFGDERAFRLLEDKLGAGMWTLDFSDLRLVCSRGLFRVFGLDPGEVDPSIQIFEQMIHPDDRRAPGELDYLISHGLPLDREFRILRNGGGIRWLSSRAETLFDPKGTPTSAVGVVIDLTEQYESNALLEFADSRLAALIRLSGSIVWSVPIGSDSIHIHSLDMEAADTPIPPDFKATIDVVHPEDQAETASLWSIAVAHRREFQMEHRLRRFSGQYGLFLSRGVPVNSSVGDAREYLGISVPLDRPIRPRHTSSRSLTGAQIRAARGLLRWSVRDLAEAASVTPAVLRRIESFDGTVGIDEAEIEVLRSTLTEAGVEFVNGAGVNPGVAPR